MLAPITHILPLATVRRERLLPIPGRVVVRKGQKVSASDVIAEGKLAPEHLLLDVERGLGLSESQADHYIQVKVGDQVAKGDVLAGPVGLARRVVRASNNGRVILAGGGQILLEIDTSPFELKAGLPGMVTELIGDRGAILEVTGALIQGVWGNGRIDSGLMNVLARGRDDELASDRLDVSMRGSVILGSYCGDVEVLKAAAELPLRGLILASLDISLLPVAAKMRYPIILIDGFGKKPMNTSAFKLLTTNERREVALIAEPWDHFTGSRPEVYIPLPASGEPPQPRETDVFTVGQQVRVSRDPYAGKIGTLINLQPDNVPLPNGLRAPSAEVRLETGDTAVLPLMNLEVLI
jgi:hypothetical protein